MGRTNMTTVYEYNRDGKEISVTKSNNNGSVLYQEINYYSLDGTLTKSTTSNNDGSSNKQIDCVYDLKGNEAIFFNGIPTYKVPTKRNKNGIATEERTFSAQGDILYKIFFDSNRRKTSAENYDYGDFEYRITYKYDDKGNLIEEKKINRFGIVIWKAQTLYDINNNPYEKEQFNWCGSHLSKERYKYDDKGNQIERKRLSRNDIIVDKRTCVYYYDKTGNWIKRIVLSNNNNEHPDITERKIEYH